MKNKLFKVLIVIFLLIVLTMTNFVYIGAEFVSYASDTVATNNQNIEFGAKLKNEDTLTLSVNVKKEGYFNGEIALENSNFIFDINQSKEYINKIESNKIFLNQINAGTNAEIDLKIKPIENENFDIGLLSSISKLNISGVYKDSTQRDIHITGTREVEFRHIENNTNENIENTSKIITNKILNISGEDKKVIQLEMNLGLKENNYPEKEINSSIIIPTPDDENPIIVSKVNLSTMKEFTCNYDDKNKIELKLSNNPNQDNKVKWNKQGSEKVVLTLIYNKDVNIENTEIQYEQKLTLYNNRELKNNNSVIIDGEEKEEIINLNAKSVEDIIYKGKLYAGIERQYETKTKIAVNLANAEEGINIIEGETKYILEDKEAPANVVFNKTEVSKELFDKILGESGQITILNESGEKLYNIDKNSPTDENGRIILDYTDKEPKELQIKISKPIAEGDLELFHTKTIKAQDRKIVEKATNLNATTSYEYLQGQVKEEIEDIKLEETKTEAELLIDKDSLSTIVTNNVEIKTVLKGNNEQYNLYKNPTILFELPQDVENIEISNMNLIYENELAIKNYQINGRVIIVNLEGEQTQYKNPSIEGATLIINTNINVNRKAATKDSQIIARISNEGQEVVNAKDIKIVAPKDVTTINSIKELGVETLGQEEVKEIALEKGQRAKQLESNIEIINNNENEINNVRIIGTFPTKNTKNNIETKVVTGINLEGVEEAKVYYTDKENATEDLQNPSNAWSENIENNTKVQKYLIEIPSLGAQASVQGTYKLEIPELLEYNQTTSEGYTAKYVNAATKVESQINATTIQMGTGVGPILEVKLVPEVGNVVLSENGSVKNGEVIKYKLAVSNTGSEDIENVILAGEVPEGTTLVEAKNNYEYAGTSYYEELEDRVFNTIVDKVPVGQTYNEEYEVRVNNNTESGTKLPNTAQIRYGEVLKQSNSTELTTEKGKLRATVKRVTDRKIDLYENSTVRYFAIVENISDEKQENVKVKTNLPSSMSVEGLTLLTGMEAIDNENTDVENITQHETKFIEEDELKIDDENNIQSEEIEYKDTVNIGTLEKGENKVLCYLLSINKIEDTAKNQFSVTAIDNNNLEHKSNSINDEIKKVNVSLTMNSNVQGQYVKSGDVLEYKITAKNNEANEIKGLKIQDYISENLTINKIKLNGKEIEHSENINDIEVDCDIEANQEAIINIETVVDYSDARITAEPITNVAYAEILGERIANTSEMTHIILAEELEDENDDNDQGNIPGTYDGDVANGKNIITGIAWLDENGNGQKDEEEKILDNVKAKLLNTQSNNLVKDKNGNTLEATTNDSGIYVLDNIDNGKYIVVFDYNNTLYTVTKYKAENVEDSKNSKAITSQLQIENEQKTVSATDIIEINNNNISNINIGLIELKDFSFRLDKYVSKVTVQTSSGTTVKEYTNATVAKAELDSKKVNGTTVIIEYELKVTNIGELDGYVRKIVDYMPNDLKFSSELNKDWYQKGNDLYNSSLANEKIVAGESKSVKLVLTKAMTENNTGLTNNTAEIAESYNELGIADSKSTAGNKVPGEEDYGSADTILSLKTGAEVYVSVIAILLVITGITVFIIIRKKQHIEDIK